LFFNVLFRYPTNAVIVPKMVIDITSIMQARAIFRFLSWICVFVIVKVSVFQEYFHKIL